MVDIASSSNLRPRPNAAIFGTAALLIALLVVPAMLAPQEFLRDDSYFYPQIAANIVAGNGSTFHEITPTNGYHPLWMAGVVAAVFVADGNRTAALHLLVVLQTVLSIALAAAFLKLMRGMRFEHGIVGLAVLLIYLFGTGVFGSEAHLNALLLVAGLAALWRALDADRASAWFATGLVFGLAILARLDNVFVVAALCGLGVFHNAAAGPAALARRAAAGALGGALVLLPYLAYNVIVYGHMTPISGVIKSTFPEFALDLNRLGAMGKLAVPFGVAALGIGAVLEREPRRRVIWLGLGAGVVLHAVYVTGFTDHYTFWPWYYVSGVVAAALVAAWLPGWAASTLPLGPLRGHVRSLAYLAAFAVLAAGAGRAWLKAYAPFELGPINVDIRVNDYHWPEEFAVWMKDNLPAGSRVFTLDWPGAFAWYSELSILPMDGLVNDFAYNDELLAEGAEQYLCARGVGYYLGLHETAGSVERVTVTAPLSREVAGVLALREEDLVMEVRDVLRDPDRALPFALWRLRCPHARGALPRVAAAPPRAAAAPRGQRSWRS